MEIKRLFGNWRELADLDNFDLLDDGRLALVEPGLEDLIDFHTHLGWTVLAPTVDLTKETLETRHHFGVKLNVDLDIYSGQNLIEQYPKLITEDLLPCVIFSISKRQTSHFYHSQPAKRDGCPQN